MARRFDHIADIGQDTRVPYSAVPRKDRGKWALTFPDADGNRVRLTTTHDVRGKHPPDEFHTDAVRLIREHYRPPSLFPTLTSKTWDELLDEVEKTSPHTRPETLRSFRQGVRAFREVMPEVTSPLDVSEERIRRFMKLWLAAPRQGSRGKGKRSPTTLSYYLRALSAFHNHLIALGYANRNPWHGHKAPKAEHTRKPVPTEDDTNHFFAWVHARYPHWHALHALLELKAISASRTADVCQLKTVQLKGGRLTFTADIVKTKEGRSLPLPEDLFATLTQVAGTVYLWEGAFWQGIKDYRKQSNGLPAQFAWKTAYTVVCNIFKEYSEAHPDRPRFTAHGLRRRAITLTVQATGSVDAAATAIGVHPQTARTHYLDAQRAFDTDETMKRVAEALRPKKDNVTKTTPEGDKGGK